MPCADCDRVQRRFKALLVDFENAEVELRAKRRRITELEGKLAGKHKADPKASNAQAVFEYWRARLHPKAFKLEGRRLKAVLDRLNDGWSVADLRRAVDGAVFDAYVGPNGVRHDDLEFICRDETNLRKFLQRADAAERAHSAVAETREPAVAYEQVQPEGRPLDPSDDGSDGWDDPRRFIVGAAKWARWDRERAHRVAVERDQHERGARAEAKRREQARVEFETEVEAAAA
jgi:hypothetical protein